MIETLPVKTQMQINEAYQRFWSNIQIGKRIENPKSIFGETVDHSDIMRNLPTKKLTESEFMGEI